MLLVYCRIASARCKLDAAAPASHALTATADGTPIDPMAATIARLDAVKHAAQARLQVKRKPFRIGKGRLTSGTVRAVYRDDEGTFDSLVLYRQKLARLESVSGDLQWAAMPKGCEICMSGRSRQGGRE